MFLTANKWLKNQKSKIPIALKIRCSSKRFINNTHYALSSRERTVSLPPTPIQFVLRLKVTTQRWGSNDASWQ